MRRVSECSVVDCRRVETLRRGWCFRHYQRWRKYGDPAAPGVAERECSVAALAPDAQCAYCGAAFRSEHSGKGTRTRFCSWACRNKGCSINEAERIERARRRDEIKTRRRRALLAQVEREPYTLAEVAERDRFICWLCERPVDMALRWPDLKSASVDHVIPLSMQGPDTPANVRLAHLGENITRGNRVDWRPSVAV